MNSKLKIRLWIFFIFFIIGCEDLKKTEAVKEPESISAITADMPEDFNSTELSALKSLCMEFKGLKPAQNEFHTFDYKKHNCEGDDESYSLNQNIYTDGDVYAYRVSASRDFYDTYKYDSIRPLKYICTNLLDSGTTTPIKSRHFTYEAQEEKYTVEVITNTVNAPDKVIKTADCAGAGMITYETKNLVCLRIWLYSDRDNVVNLYTSNTLTFITGSTNLNLNGRLVHRLKQTESCSKPDKVSRLEATCRK